ncbi:MAG: ABC transporter substrate-binding protein [Pseudomonadota bacterium]
MAASRLIPILTLAIGLALPVHAADESAALQVADTLVEDAHGALTAQAGADERAERLRAALQSSFAFDIWERFLIDPEKDGFSADQMIEFRALLPGFLANLYANQFGKGLEAKPEIIEARPARKDILVRAAIPRANGKNLPVDWRIRDLGDRGHMVIDVMVGGTSFLILKRDEFRGVLDQGGPEGLLDFMRQNSI